MGSSISIIVPIYNVEKYLNRCVDSLINQTLKDIEIILVDDGSPDNCPKMCDEYAKLDSRIKVVHKQNGGLVSAWKAGVMLASSEYIGFVDPDDYCDLTYFEELYKPILKDYDLDIVSCGFKSINGSNIINHKVSNYIETGVYEGDKLQNLKDRFFEHEFIIVPSRWTKLIRKSILLNNIDLIDDRITMAEDLCTTFACIMDANKLALVEKYGYNYVIFDGSMSHKFNKRALDNYNIFANILKKIVKVKNLYIDINPELNIKCSRLLVAILASNLFYNEKISNLKTLRNNDIVKEVLNDSSSHTDCSKSTQIVNKLFKLKMYNTLILGSIIWKCKR